MGNDSTSNPKAGDTRAGGPDESRAGGPDDARGEEDTAKEIEPDNTPRGGPTETRSG